MWVACLSRKVKLPKIERRRSTKNLCYLTYVLSIILCFVISTRGIRLESHNAKVEQEGEAQRQNGDEEHEEEDKGEDENENNEDTGTSIILNVTQSEYFAYRPHVRRSNEKVNSINASGIPLSELNLKVGCPIMILCNFDPASCVLEVCLIRGQHDGKTHFIPCITFSYCRSNWFSSFKASISSSISICNDYQ